MMLLYKRQSSTQTPSTGLRHPSFLWRKVPESDARGVSSTLSGAFKFRSKEEPLVKEPFSVTQRLRPTKTILLVCNPRCSLKRVTICPVLKQRFSDSTVSIMLKCDWKEHVFDSMNVEKKIKKIMPSFSCIFFYPSFTH